MFCGLCHQLFRDSEVTFPDTFVPSDISVLNIRSCLVALNASQVFQTPLEFLDLVRYWCDWQRLAIIPGEIGRIIAVQSFLGGISTELERKDRCPISREGHILSDQRLHSSDSLNKEVELTPSLMMVKIVGYNAPHC